MNMDLQKVKKVEEVKASLIENDAADLELAKIHGVKTI